MKAKLLFLIFILAASAWCLIVITFATTRGVNMDTPIYIAYPWAGIVLGVLGGFMIGALGLRVYSNANHKAFMRKLAEAEPLRAQGGNDPLVPCQVGHREAYLDLKTARGL